MPRFKSGAIILQSALCYVNRPLEGLPGIDDYGQYAQCASGDHVAAGAVGVEEDGQ